MKQGFLYTIVFVLVVSAVFAAVLALNRQMKMFLFITSLRSGKMKAYA